MFEKIADILGKLNGVVLMAIALGIVAVVFVVGLICSFGGDLGKFKKAAKKALKNPSMQSFNATAKELPLRVRKQYKTVKQTGAKPDDVITIDAAVYAPYKESVAAHLPNAVMAAGILSVLFAFFTCFYVKDSGMLVIPAVVTVGVMVLRLLAGLISTLIVRGGVKVYGKYVEKLNECMHGGITAEQGMGVEYDQTAEPMSTQASMGEEPVMAQQGFDPMFDEPQRISVELADDEQPQVADYGTTAYAEPVVETPVETPEEQRARVRAEAAARLKEEQAQREAERQQAEAARQQAEAQAAAQREAAKQAAAQRIAAQQAAQQAAAEAAKQAAQPPMSSADEVVARIEKLLEENGSLAEMRSAALLLQKERAKPENKTPEQQRKLSAVLQKLVKAMQTAQSK